MTQSIKEQHKSEFKKIRCEVTILKKARIHRTVQKDLQDPGNHDNVIAHLEPDILECEVNGP